MSDYTVKDLADRLKVSKTTVKKYIKANKINYDYMERNKEFYSFEKAKKIIKLIDTTYDLKQFEAENSQAETANSKENLENSQAETANSKENLENSQNESENSQGKQDITEKMLEMLQKEIDKKDQEIKDLRDRLDKAYDTIADMANKAQYITAADKTAQIIDKSQAQEEKSQDQDEKIEPVTKNLNIPEPKQEEPKGFFARLFNRNK